MPGWERLPTCQDPYERRALRYVLEGAIRDRDEREEQRWKRLVIAVQNGVAAAFN